jgi:predicted nucleic acid-binding protein
MKVFLDTSVLIPAVVKDHEDHARAFRVLKGVHDGRDEGVVSAHGIAEMYAVLTKLPAPFRHSPEQALMSIEENVLKSFKVSSLTGADYSAVIRDAAAARIQGGTVYDGVLLKCAIKAEVARIYTFNLRHFQAVAPEEIRGILSLP